MRKVKNQKKSRLRFVLAAFGPYLDVERNISQEIVSQVQVPHDAKKVLLPVGYNKQAFLRPLKKNPRYYIILGSWQGSYLKIERYAKNNMIILTNPFWRACIQALTQVLWLFKKNIRVKNIPDKKHFTFRKINEKTNRDQLTISLPLKKEGIFLSDHAGYFVCNYAMWTIQEQINKKKLRTKLFFVHIPEKATKKQEKLTIAFLKHLLRIEG